MEISSLAQADLQLLGSNIPLALSSKNLELKVYTNTPQLLDIFK